MLTGYYIIAMSGCVKSVMHDTMAYDKRKCLFYNYYITTHAMVVNGMWSLACIQKYRKLVRTKLTQIGFVFKYYIYSRL